ncbi:MAG: ferredoxin--NADP reductase [Thiobacillus sp.]|uniref:ferredoxin--NADP reductase n=1 Tax=Thiobacillus sp. TaxID=924 RepID=UPI002894324B|nr:ferredoxin--NADP reductase [Thiobacillus sp.]MDT3706519.1 ferredoxin--NADP reductase [Thiobacillus sp.]
MSEWVEASVVERIRWNDALISLRFEAELEPFEAGQFIRAGLDVDGERIGRPYSLVNAPDERPHEIYFNVVREGPLSPRLAQLRSGEGFWVAPTPNGFLTLDEIPAARDLWLLATGTGVGPFLSILKTAAPWSRFEKVVLGHSVHTQGELSYQETIREMQQRHPAQFRFVPFITREPCDGQLCQRIPASIEDGALERKAGLDLAPETAHVMLCGNSGMLQDALASLEKRGMKRHRRREPGHVSMEKYH